MKVAVDGMGGDNAPGVVVEGVAEALRRYPDLEVLLVGHEKRMAPFIKKHGLTRHPRLNVVHAEQAVRMDEPSTTAVRAKKDSSITVAASLVAKGEADALVSAGHTGATVAATKIKMRMLPGVDRPAIATIMPATQGPFILLDAGANIDCKPIHLAQFAVMGEVFARLAFSALRPRIGLLSVGEEDVKGNDLTKEAFKILSDMPLNFVGNVEGNMLFHKAADVVVCDGFVGNVLLKSSEGMAKASMYWLKEALSKNPIRMTGAILMKQAFKELKEIGDAEEYGGARLLGVNGICIIGHGSSSPKAIRNAIRVAEESVKFGMNRIITNNIADAEIGVGQDAKKTKASEE